MVELRLAVLGAGNIASVHARAVHEAEGASLAIVADGGSGRGRALAERFGARYLPDAALAATDDEVDAVIVATPSGRHADAVIAAAARGKHALVEKPLDVTLERCDAMIRAAQEHGTVLAGVFQNRFAPGVARAREALAAGRLGKLVLANGLVPWYRSPAYYREGGWRGTWKLDGGGALMNQGIHTVDLLLHLAGPVARVSADIGRRVHATETEDTAAATLAFADGAFGALQATTASWPGEPARVALYGEAGTIVLDDGRITGWHLRDADEAEVEAMLRLDAAPGGGSADPLAIGVERHRAQLEDFLRAVAERRQPAVTPAEARGAVELVLAVYASARAGAPVGLPLAG